MRTFEYRLYPTKAQQKQLMACLEQSRHLYNEMLERTKAQYQQSGKFLFKYDLTRVFRSRGGETVPATTVQTLADRLDKALRRFLAHKALGLPVGFPRFKSANRWHTIQLRQYGRGRDVWLAGDGKHLHVPAKLGKLLKIKRHRPLEGIPKTGYLILRADGHWYVSIVCESPPVQISREDTGDIGLDMGLKSFLADSAGNVIQPPQFFCKAEAILRRKQRALSRCQRHSRRRRKAARNVAKTHLKIVRQRRDWLFNVAKPYAEKYARIFIEDLNVSGMVRNHHVAKSIADAAWSEFFAILTHKAASAGHQVVKVPARFTSQRCSACGRGVAKSLSVRTHMCPHCGLIEDRDINAARNILQAGARPSGANGDIGRRGLRNRWL